MSMSFYAAVVKPQSDGSTLIDKVGEWGPNLSNCNADMVVRDLGLLWDSVWEIDHFINITQGYLAINMASTPATPDIIVDNPGRVTVIHCGLVPDYMKTRVQQLLDTALTGKALGATHFTGA